MITDKKIMRFNKMQDKALENALNQKLSLIWGPPGSKIIYLNILYDFLGTGKTSIGCVLSYAFSIKNAGSKGVVLYCGPSNDCVNLVARM